MTNRSHTALKSVNRGHPCPVCEGIDGCSIGEDDVILCRRRNGSQAGFVCLGNAKADPQWTLFRRDGDPALSVNTPQLGRNGNIPKPTTDWRRHAEVLARNLRPDRVENLAEILGLPVAALYELPLLGFCENGPHQGEHLRSLGECWTFPEVDASGAVIGLTCRYRNGHKKAWPGGKRGLSIPTKWNDRHGPILLPEGSSDVLALTAICLPAVGRPSNMGGVALLTELLRDTPTDRQIVVLGERDANDKRMWPGKDGAIKTASELSAALCRPVSWVLPPDGSKDVRAWILSKNPDPTCADAWHELGDEFLRVLNLDEATARVNGTYSLPIKIDVTNEDLAVITPAAWSAIHASNVPAKLFRYGNVPSRIESDDVGTPMLRPMTVDRMRHYLARAATWVKVDKRQGAEVPASPPLGIVRDVLATPDPDLPILTRIVEVPIFAADGTLCTTPGYSLRSRTYYAPASGFIVPTISEHPSAVEINSARQLICDELMGDFPFIGDAEKAHAVAALLAPFVRDMIEGPTPLHSFEAPTPGTGKTLLVDLLTYPALGRPITAMTEGRDEDEWRKRLFAKLRSAPSTLLLDNIKRQLDSGALASAITSYPYWEDRILGVSEIACVPVRCTWILTGNNPSLSTELTRRTIRIRLDARVDRPWLRETFQKPDIRAWAFANRDRLVWAALTLIRAWLARRRPEGSRTLGMFERWAKVMGGILEVAGIPGFLGNLADFYEASDSEGLTWCDFLAMWFATNGESCVKVSALWQFAIESSLDLGEKGEQSQKIRLGKLLRDMRDRTFTVTLSGEDKQLRIESSGADHRATLWRLAEIKRGSGECGRVF